MQADVAESRSWKRLEILARRPFDLTGEGALAGSGRIKRMVCDSAALKMMFATQRIDEEVLEALQDFADEHRLVHRFNEMRSGVILNKISGWESEERKVLHTTTRDLFSGNPVEPESAAQAETEFRKLSGFLAEIESGKIVGTTGKPFTTMINVGIGGSDLGPRSVYEALKPFRQAGRQVRFIANVDPDNAAEVLQAVELERTLVTVVSKSGSTLETLTNEMLVRRAFTEAGMDPLNHFLAVTEVGSPMDNPERYLRSFYLFDYIGGRYSSTSMAGCVMLGFALGLKHLKRFLLGANEMDDVAAGQYRITENMPLLLALIGIWNHNFLGYPTLAVLPYSQGLHRFPAHLQQCDMESNGKSITVEGKPVACKTGPVIWGEPGTNGQHAFYQLLHQGTEIIPVEFIGFQQSRYDSDIVVQGTTSQQKLVANLLAQAQALALGQKNENPNRRFAGNRPSLLIIGDRLDPLTMGQLLALYEAKIVFQGFSWRINSFDQEGVQLGKQLAKRFLELMRGGKKNGLTVEEQLFRVLEK